ncbi:MAG: SdpI family protein [bacterium]|nr:SdpI family protein [bacterium]
MSSPIKPTVKTEIIPWLLIVFSLAASAYLYSRLPERVATHWNFAGQSDGYGSGKAQAVIFPLLIIGLYLMFLFIPYIDPKKDRYAEFSKIYHIFKNIILTMMAVIYAMVGLNGLGYSVPVGLIMPALIGSLFIVIGNYMGKIKRNWFMGIRTPWTLSSEEVWNKTHRFGGKMFILAGILMIANIFLPASWRLPVFIFSIVAIVLGTIGYSYLAYVQEKKK